MERLLFTLVVAVFLLLPKLATADELLIIANPSVDLPKRVTLDWIAAAYLLRVTTWPDGTRIVPVNREATSSARTTFTARVLRQDSMNLAAYWNQMHFKGKLPPVVQESEQAMLAFVQTVPGSIGYIRKTTKPVNVKVVGHVH